MDRVSKYKDILFQNLVNNYTLPCEKEDLPFFLFVSPPSLRLTYDGFKFMKKNFENYDFPTGKDMVCKQLYNMDSLFTAPYYKSTSKIYLFSKKDTFIVRLHGNDVACYLDRGFEWDGNQNNN